MQGASRVQPLKQWSLTLLGLLFLSAAGGHILIGDDRSLVDTIEVGLPILIAIGLVLGGIWLKRTHSPQRTFQMTKWTFGGALVGHAINLWLLFIISLGHTPAGEPVPLNLNGAAVFMAAGAILGYYYTGLEARERALEQSDARFHALTENAAFGVVTIDDSSTIRYANDAVEELFGYTPEDLVGEPLTVLMPNSLEDGHRDGLARYLKEGERTIDWDGVELTGQHATGDEFPVEISFGEYAVDEEHLFTGVVRDISERKAAEARLQAHTNRITALHRVATDIMEAETTDGVYQRTVDGAHEVLPCDVARLAIADGDQLVPAASSVDEQLDACDPIDATTGYAGQCFQSGEPVVVDDLTFTRSATTAQETAPDADSDPDGTSSPHIRDGGTTTESDAPTYRSLLSVPLDDFGVLQLLAVEADAFDTDESDVATLLASHASTALTRVRAEETIRRERDRLDEFASVLSHDLRNPLNVAQGRLELAQRTGDGGEHLDAIEHAHGRIERLIDDVLTLAREGEAVGDTEPVHLDSLAREAWETVNTEEAGELHIDAPGRVDADRSRLLQVFENLYRNAIEHGGEGVTITVGALENGFYIEDDGPGIPADESEEVFDSGYTTSTDGTGFGLTIVQRIVEAHGWQITVTEGSDGGARFEVRAAVSAPSADPSD
ncbi:PAS domain S-box protein [Haloarcula nitratireducens]|uniref:histidine kinase n=1 Tax=Haloarcula nitratireducens TaxID=2487749 RepID=A0AAW4PJH2_9EURY|nr:PAS domain S-box protein [Halomicroarcula nitratireducens]MBX0298129.1 PAS domain S-box protein [Halomicroarcula nitratireducens]